MKFLEPPLIALDAEAASAEEAIRLAGALLTEAGAAEARYADAMVESYRERGPYFVLAPSIALPHARAQDGVIEAAVSFVRLKEPVVFGHRANDPVQLVFALGGSDSGEHIALLRQLTTLLSSPAHLEQFKQAADVEAIQQIIRGNEQ
ncbi:PTS system mannitol-specific IIA component/PTS system ascorbate-specific IIA component [Paenibacillus rhizosphaerae]|uniref:PTS system mannitol-specific IIA component/PTS system ascorbate-specific IIA component n=1 Tax=Paenibacillus rhizosphaerae TaxID=297318 RepID=A0A839TQM6_9BACL|nr:PTS sugar transporter subunit IIA [Paenibacillus rhizosphaerae]MBB3129065.1 PTS system mannitol-specific IIA component/PTS system ascorbate-specific IIA component [Paenibacillus rhizosphaerae]